MFTGVSADGVKPIVIITLIEELHEAPRSSREDPQSRLLYNFVDLREIFVELRDTPIDAQGNAGNVI